VDAPTETEMSAGPAVNASQVVIEVNFDWKNSKLF
jgi:hypothetical protein